MIEVKNLTGGYGKYPTVRDVNFKTLSGKKYGILGKPNAGKSTLLSLLSGSLTPDSGEIFINGFDLQKESASAKALIGYCPDGFRLPSGMTVSEALLWISVTKSVSYDESVRSVCDLLDFLNLSGKKDRLIGNLTVMEQRSLEVAQAFLGRREILFLDAPAKGLTPSGVQEIFSLADKLRTEEQTVFLASRNLVELEEFCDEILLLSKGKLVGIFASGDENLKKQFASLPEEAPAEQKSSFFSPDGKKGGSGKPRRRESFFRLLTEKREEEETDGEETGSAEKSDPSESLSEAGTAPCPESGEHQKCRKKGQKEGKN